MADSQAEVEALVQALQRDFNCAVDPDRSLRKSAVQKITKRLLGSGREPAPSSAAVQAVIEGPFLKPLQHLLGDSVEKCRDVTANFLYEVLPTLPHPSAVIADLLPSIVARIGVKPSPEESEELRLLMLKVVDLFVTTSPSAIAPHLDKVVDILTKTAVDSYPEIKKETARCVINVRTKLPDVFVHHSPAVIRALSGALSHQHSRVRAAALEAIGMAVCCNGESVLKELQPGLKILAADRSPAVREVHARVAAQWLKSLVDVKDYEGLIVPLLAVHVGDEIATNRDYAIEAMEEVASVRAAELEGAIKDDTTSGRVWEEERPVAPFSERPSAVCRALVSRSLKEYIPGVLEDLVNWTAKTRGEAASLLRVLVVYCEDNVLEHLDAIINAATKACRDDDTTVSSAVGDVMEYVGRCIDPSAFLPKVLSMLERPAHAGPSSQLSCLVVMASLMKGCQPGALVEHIPSIITSLGKVEVMSSELVDEVESEASVITERAEVAQLNEALTDTVVSLIRTAGKAIEVEGSRIFHLLVQLLAVEDTSTVAQKAAYGISLLASVLELGEAEEGRSKLFARYYPKELSAIISNVNEWSKASHERLCFETLTRNLAAATSLDRDEDVDAVVQLFGQAGDEMMEAFKTMTSVATDAHLRMGGLGLLDDLCSYPALTPFLSSHSLLLLRDVVLPNMVWRAGRVAAAVRIVATHCLRTMLRRGCIARDSLAQLLDDMVPTLKTSLDDDEKETRLMTCHILHDCFDVIGEGLSDENRYQLYPELLSRLDDSSDDVRVDVTETLSSFLRNLAEPIPNETQVEYITKRLLIHLDDSQESIRLAVKETLLMVAKRAPAIMKEEAAATASKLIRGGDLLEEVLRTC
eukprot:CAMPEP_0113901314 /NCGR_PEP_ID=MMETSP0780_2-20120614/21180_1 /TAXON_ID=652834 /ORGANISM="Palpitomonas bilix" /LENGTH=867 /DNA_ID=CAMNT_0000893903 /DNA_START=96 /DNA_END=2699 /DNA_ORIENTATION=- /assembly_acc=CAM_ASM_000599